jgi:heavy-metal-associated domain-containing protein
MSSVAVSSGQSSGSGESSGLVRIELLVTGMTCAACAAKVEGSLNALENVTAR